MPQPKRESRDTAVYRTARIVTGPDPTRVRGICVVFLHVDMLHCIFSAFRSRVRNCTFSYHLYIFFFFYAVLLSFWGRSLFVWEAFSIRKRFVLSFRGCCERQKEREEKRERETERERERKTNFRRKRGGIFVFFFSLASLWMRVAAYLCLTVVWWGTSMGKFEFRNKKSST